MLDRIAFALKDIGGKVQVYSHTTASAAKSFGYHSSFELSQKQVNMVSSYFKSYESISRSVDYFAKGDTENTERFDIKDAPPANRLDIMILNARTSQKEVS